MENAATKIQKVHRGKKARQSVQDHFEKNVLAKDSSGPPYSNSIEFFREHDVPFDPNKCQAITSSKKQCQTYRIAGTKYCHRKRHQRQGKPLEFDEEKCQAVTHKGNQCQSQKVSGGKYCHRPRHQKQKDSPQKRAASDRNHYLDGSSIEIGSDNAGQAMSREEKIDESTSKAGENISNKQKLALLFYSADHDKDQYLNFDEMHWLQRITNPSHEFLYSMYLSICDVHGANPDRGLNLLNFENSYFRDDSYICRDYENLLRFQDQDAEERNRAISPSPTAGAKKHVESNLFVDVYSHISHQEKLTMIFYAADRDKDGFLNFDEMNWLQKITNPAHIYLHKTWKDSCALLGAKYQEGMNREQFELSYFRDWQMLSEDYTSLVARGMNNSRESLLFPSGITSVEYEEDLDAKKEEEMLARRKERKESRKKHKKKKEKKSKKEKKESKHKRRAKNEIVENLDESVDDLLDGDNLNTTSTDAWASFLSATATVDDGAIEKTGVSIDKSSGDHHEDTEEAEKRLLEELSLLEKEVPVNLDTTATYKMDDLEKELADLERISHQEENETLIRLVNQGKREQNLVEQSRPNSLAHKQKILPLKRGWTERNMAVLEDEIEHLQPAVNSGATDAMDDGEFDEMLAVLGNDLENNKTG
jgi:hypothetical protein